VGFKLAIMERTPLLSRVNYHKFDCMFLAQIRLNFHISKDILQEKLKLWHL